MNTIEKICEKFCISEENVQERILLERTVDGDNFVVVYGGKYGDYLYVNGHENYVTGIELHDVISAIIRFDKSEDIENEINKDRWGKEINGFKYE